MESSNTQAIVAGGHRTLARFGFVRLEAEHAGRELLRGMHDWITIVGGAEPGPGVRFGVAVSAAGLAMLGVPTADLAACPALFREGPAAFPSTAADSGSSDIARWDRPWRNHPADLLCMMSADAAEDLDTHWDWLGELVDNTGNRMLERQDAIRPAAGRDHFGVPLPYPEAGARFPEADSPPPGLGGDGTWCLLHKMAENVPLFRRIAETVPGAGAPRQEPGYPLQVSGLVYGAPLPGRLADDRRDRGVLLVATAARPDTYLDWLEGWRRHLEVEIRLADDAPAAHEVGIHDRLPELLTTRGLRTFFVPGMRALRLLA